jgi:regulatory protein
MKKASGNSLKSKALRLLAMREHSRVELKRKLEAKAEEGDDVEAVLDRMAETGLQSDERFAESYIRARATRLGTSRLQYELIKRGVTQEIASTALGEVLELDEYTRARDVWQRKFGALPSDRQDWARQARFLQSRGFAAEIIRKLLRDGFDESAES